MFRIPSLEQLGVGVAVMSDRSDGDAASDDGLSGILHELKFVPADLATVHQEHGVRIVQDRAGGKADGIITNRPGLSLGIRVADCVPVYVVDPRNRAIGLFHAGRVGTVGEIARCGISAMQSNYETRPVDCHAYIGPSAGPCCYEVSGEMVAEFRVRGWGTRGHKIDLWDANLRQLIAAGVPRRNIECCGLCTICQGTFYSYRGGDTNTRNMAILTL